MRRVILACVLLAICSDVALAAKKRKPRPVPPPPPLEYVAIPPLPAIYNWTGFYAGTNVGGGWANAKSDFNASGAVFGTAKNSLEGVNGGFQLGYNWQNGPTVLGFESDFQFANQRGSLDAPPCPTPTCAVATSASYSQKQPWFGTVRGRFGHASDTWLAYVTGGYAYTRLDTSATATAGATTVSVNQSEIRSGWTAGAGVEVALGPRWTAKMEYLYMDFGSRDVTWAFAGLPTITDRIRLYDNVVRAGVNYRF